jgi:hypothetical protein
MKIKEIQQTSIKLSSMVMNRDAPIKGNEDTPFPNYGFACLISGAPSSGKTSLLMSQLLKPNTLFYKKFDIIHIFSPSIHTMKTKMDLDPEFIHDEWSMETLQGILDYSTEKTKQKSKDETLIIFDDMISEIIGEKDLKTFNKMLLNRSHMKISIIILTQSYIKIPAFLRRNMSHFIQLYTKNKSELDRIFEEHIFIPKKDFDKLAEYIFQQPYDFLTIDKFNNIYRNLNKIVVDIPEK